MIGVALVGFITVFAASVSDRDTGYALTAEQVADSAAEGKRSESEVGTGDCAA